MPLRPLPRAEALGLDRLRARTVIAWLSASLVLAAAGFASTTARAQPGEAESRVADAMPAKPLWRDLSSRQQKALQPLAPYWDEMTESHKRKWLAISRDYAKLSPAEQEVLHSRMTEWASLSNQQRAQARANFANVKQVPVDERKAKWEAYQALSAEEKSRLAARAAPAKTPGAAPTIRPVPAQKLVSVPAVGPDAQHIPRIQLAPPPTAATHAQTRPVAPVAPAAAPAVAAQPPAPPAPAPAPAFPPVSAEQQVPPPTAAEPPVHTTEQQPSAAP
jgi:hypothetical protein